LFFISWDNIVLAFELCCKGVRFLSYPDGTMSRDFVSQVIRFEEGYIVSCKKIWLTSWVTRGRRALLLQGVVQKIVDSCSFENLSNFGVNATGIYHKALPP
jgi:hypothetical protein